MIVKQWEEKAPSSDPRLRAGAEAERQMAFYLHRAFAQDESVLVLNDLRLEDPEQPEFDGRPGACQIDHLILHRWGAFIVESKSVSGEVRVKDDGQGGDMWTRSFGRTEVGFASPIQQARRQAEFLRSFLQRHREALLGKVPAGLRTVARLLFGTDQRTFGQMPLQIIVAISDGGRCSFERRWRPPEKPFQTFVTKADQVVDKVRSELERHRESFSVLGKSDGEYGVWSAKPEEIEAVAAHLVSHHRPREAGSTHAAPTAGTSASTDRVGSVPSPAAAAPPMAPARPAAPPRPAMAANAGATDIATSPAIRQDSKQHASAALRPRCKKCGGTELVARWGKFGYHWNCACGANTAMPTICSICGAVGSHGKGVRIRKDGGEFRRACEACGIEECIWREQGAAT